MSWVFPENVPQTISGSCGRLLFCEGVVLAAAVAVNGLLDAAPALIEGVTSEADDVERVHDRDRVGRDPEPLGNPRHRQVLARDGFQRPPQPTT